MNKKEDLNNIRYKEHYQKLLDAVKEKFFILLCMKQMNVLFMENEIKQEGLCKNKFKSYNLTKVIK